MNLDNYQRPTRRQAIKGEARTYREKLVTDFMEKLNECRKAGGFVPMSYPRVAKMLKGYDEVQLQRLYGDCMGARSFSALFFSKIKKHT